eukprot:6607411-Alexandrium_andersonii.AAC.1
MDAMQGKVEPIASAAAGGGDGSEAMRSAIKAALGEFVKVMKDELSDLRKAGTATEASAAAATGKRQIERVEVGSSDDESRAAINAKKGRHP